MSDTPDVLAAVRRLAARYDAHMAEGKAIRVDLADLERIAEASIPKTPDGKAIPPRQLDAAREIVGKMLASGIRPSMTAVAGQLRFEGFRLTEGAEPAIWRHVAPLVECQPEPAAEPAEPWGEVASLPGSSVLLDGREWQEAG